MDPILHEALAEEATRQGVIDTDILTAYPEQLKGVKLGADGKPDFGTVYAAVKEIKHNHPALFREQDFEKMDAAQYDDAETTFREKLRRQSRPAERNNNFSQLDAALLSSEESDALRRFLGGNRSSYDRSVLNTALRRQNGLDAA
jgi:hypothetical protein